MNLHRVYKDKQLEKWKHAFSTDKHILNISELSHELVLQNRDANTKEFQPIAATILIHTAVGNHEIQYSSEWPQQIIFVDFHELPIVSSGSNNNEDL